MLSSIKPFRQINILTSLRIPVVNYNQIQIMIFDFSFNEVCTKKEKRKRKRKNTSKKKKIKKKKKFEEKPIYGSTFFWRILQNSTIIRNNNVIVSRLSTIEIVNGLYPCKDGFFFSFFPAKPENRLSEAEKLKKSP